jgi:hypothetical protein
MLVPLFTFSQIAVEANLGLASTNWRFHAGGIGTVYNQGYGYSSSLKVKVFTIESLNLEFYPEIKYGSHNSKLMNDYFLPPSNSLLNFEYKQEFRYFISYSVLDVGLGVYKTFKINNNIFVRGGVKLLKNSIQSQKTRVERNGVDYFEGNPVSSGSFSYTVGMSLSIIKKINEKIALVISYQYEMGRKLYFPYTDAQYKERNQSINWGVNYTFNN